MLDSYQHNDDENAQQEGEEKEFYESTDLLSNPDGMLKTAADAVSESRLRKIGGRVLKLCRHNSRKRMRLPLNLTTRERLGLVGSARTGLLCGWSFEAGRRVHVFKIRSYNTHY